jgi:hypothetical protein
MQLQPDPSLGPSTFPDDHRAFFDPAETVLQLNEPFNLPAKGMKTIRVNTGKFTVNAHVNSITKGDRLYVIFHGARRSGKVDGRSCFVRHDYDSLYDGPILSLSDPQTEGTWGTALPRSGMFMGTFENDLVPETNALVDKVCDELGIDRSRVVFYGSSAGGSAAILTGSRREAGCGVLAVCPGLRVEQYREQIVAAAAAAAGGTLQDFERVKNEQAYRVNPLKAMGASIGAGRKVKYFIAQSLDDAFGLNRHYRGLWKRFEIDADGGVDSTGNVFAVTYVGSGHGREPDELCRPLLKMANEFFDGKIGSVAAGAPAAKKAAPAKAAKAAAE